VKRWIRKTRTPFEAALALSQRYEEQALAYPTMRRDIPKERYISVNLMAAQTFYEEV